MFGWVIVSRSDVTGLDRKSSLEASTLFQFAIESEMYSGVGHIIKLISPQNLT
jgi:hypothetical protein